MTNTTNTTTRATITGTDTDCTLSYDDAFTGERITRHFFITRKNGYVREWLASGDARQVCERLSSRGWTLLSSDVTATVRREYRRMRAAEKKGWA